MKHNISPHPSPCCYMCLINTFDLIRLAFYRTVLWMWRLADYGPPRLFLSPSETGYSYSQCLIKLIYLWAFPNIGCCVKRGLELTFVSREKAKTHHRATTEANQLFWLSTCPVSQNECTHSEWSMTRQMLHFKLVHVSAPVRLHACLHRSSNSCILQKMCNSAPSGHTFWWVAEFGETTAISGDDATFFSSSAPYRVANRQLAQKKKKKNTNFSSTECLGTIYWAPFYQTWLQFH